MSLSEIFPPLYQCSTCLVAVKVTQGAGGAVEIDRSCGHDSVVWANRKVTLVGKGDAGPVKRAARKIVLSVRQGLSAATGRSV